MSIILLDVRLDQLQFGLLYINILYICSFFNCFGSVIFIMLLILAILLFHIIKIIRIISNILFGVSFNYYLISLL